MTNSDLATSVAETVERFKQLSTIEAHKQWTAATNGTEDNLKAAADARSETMRFLADANLFQQYRTWDESHAAGDDQLLARQIHLLHHIFAGNQRDPEVINEISQLMM